MFRNYIINPINLVPEIINRTIKALNVAQQVIPAYVKVKPTLTKIKDTAHSFLSEKKSIKNSTIISHDTNANASAKNISLPVFFQ